MNDLTSRRAGRTPAWGALAAAGCAVLLTAAAPEPGPGVAGAEVPGVPAVPDDNVCGSNCFLMFLRSWGYEAPPGAVFRQTPRGYYGTSLLEMKQFAEKLGVEAGVYKCGVEDLGVKCVLPAVALMTNRVRLGRASRQYQGHYVLVYSLDPGPDGEVHWFDGTFGYDFRRPKSEFARSWTGYVLSRPRRDGRDRWVRWATAAHAAAWAAGLWLAWRLARARRGAPA